MRRYYVLEVICLLSDTEVSMIKIENKAIKILKRLLFTENGKQLEFEDIREGERWLNRNINLLSCDFEYSFRVVYKKMKE